MARPEPPPDPETPDTQDEPAITTDDDPMYIDDTNLIENDIIKNRRPLRGAEAP